MVLGVTRKNFIFEIFSTPYSLYILGMLANPRYTYISYSSDRTEVLLKSSSEIILWHLYNYAAERKRWYRKLMPRDGFVG